MSHCVYVRASAMEALKSGTVDVCRGRGVWGGGSPSPVIEVKGYHPGNFFENIGANLCNLVHLWRPVQQKIYNSVFNLDFRRSI